VGYAELAVTSNFTFLRGASHPEEFVERAAELGYRGVAIADRNTLAGIVRAHVAAKEAGIGLAVGCRVEIDGGSGRGKKESESTGPLSLCLSVPLSLLLFPTSRPAYSRLCRLLTLGKRRAPKGECHLTLHDLLEHQEGMLGVVVPRTIDEEFVWLVEGLARTFDDDRLSIAAWREHGPDDAARLAQVAALAERTGVPMVATNDAHYHVPRRRALQDVVTCIRHGCTIEEAGFRLHANAERHLKPAEEMARLFEDYPEAIARSVEVFERASAFSLDELRYEYPVEPCPEGMPAMAYLRELTWAGARERYPEGVPEKVRETLEHELALIEELRYEAYFLTCYDIVKFARSKGILCQGRGGAANSAVCYCLGITAVDPAKFSLLFERFVSRERGEPPDIDIDFEHERREEVIQYIYEKYGRERAALTAEVISYRGRSAVREVGKAMGLSLDCVDTLAKNLDRWHEPATAQRVSEVGLSPDDPTIARVVWLTRELMGFPRHLSQHVGGFVITRSALSDLVPIENAAMEDRTVIEWDKDDIDAMGMLKVDCLGLGMLTCVRKGLELLGVWAEGTEGQRDRGTKCGEGGVEENELEGTEPKGDDNEQHSDISGSEGVAVWNGFGESDLSRDGSDAENGDVRSDPADAEGGRVDTFKYRGGVRPTKPERVHQIPANSSWVSRGTGNAARIGCLSNDAGTSRSSDGTAAGGGSHAAVVAHATGRAIAVSLPLSLCPSVPLSLSYSTLANHPSDPAVYDMICAADTIGVFQIESRAQMSMLPRLRPREFYDLVIEVAIVRPGPIQGGMVHPYLRRRAGEEPVEYPRPEVEEVLGRTLGVPIFQEQAMRLAIVAGGFTPDEADQLRRAMAAWRRKGDKIARFGEKLIAGMLERGYPREFAERCFEQIRGFSEYGFPESHAASFAILVYVSAWLKRYHPAAFAAALINSQPMGFYLPAQIVRDAREHGVEVRPVDVNWSGWDCRLEEGTEGLGPSASEGVREEGMEARRHEGTEDGKENRDGENREQLDCGPGAWGVRGPALRLGMRLVKGLREDDAEKIERAVERDGPFESIEALWRASGASVGGLRCLARADAFRSMGLDRRAALWAIRPLRDQRLPLFEMAEGTEGQGDRGTKGRDEGVEDEVVRLPVAGPSWQVDQDYAFMGLSLKAHPISFIRDQLDRLRVTPNAELRSATQWPQGRRVAVAGVVLCRQRPSTASGVVFITLEDETGIANLVIWSNTFERYRRVARLATGILARGRVERQGEVVHVHVDTLESLDERLGALGKTSRDFH